MIFDTQGGDHWPVTWNVFSLGDHVPCRAIFKACLCVSKRQAMVCEAVPEVRGETFWEVLRVALCSRVSPVSLCLIKLRNFLQACVAQRETKESLCCSVTKGTFTACYFVFCE